MSNVIQRSRSCGKQGIFPGRDRNNDLTCLGCSGVGANCEDQATVWRFLSARLLTMRGAGAQNQWPPRESAGTAHSGPEGVDKPDLLGRARRICNQRNGCQEFWPDDGLRKKESRALCAAKEHSVRLIATRKEDAVIVRSQTCVRVREVPRLRRSELRAKPRHAQVVRVQIGGLCGVKPAVILPRRDQI